MLASPAIMAMGFPRLLLAPLVVLCAFTAVADGADICNMTEDGLRECMAAVTVPGPPPPPPTSGCCAGLAQADLPCLCSYHNSWLLLALGIDPTLAMQLPAKCGLPPPAQC